MRRIVRVPWFALFLAEVFEITCSRPADLLRESEDGCTAGLEKKALHIDPGVSSFMQESTKLHRIWGKRALHKEGVTSSVVEGGGKLKFALQHRLFLLKESLGVKHMPSIYHFGGMLFLVATPIVVAVIFVLFLANPPPPENRVGTRGFPCCPWPPRERPVQRIPVFGFEQDKGKDPIDANMREDLANPATEEPSEPSRCPGPSLSLEEVADPPEATGYRGSSSRRLSLDTSEPVQYADDPPVPWPEEMIHPQYLQPKKHWALLVMTGPKIRNEEQHSQLFVKLGEQILFEILIDEHKDAQLKKGIRFQSPVRPEVDPINMDTIQAFVKDKPRVEIWSPYHPNKCLEVVVQPSPRIQNRYDVIPVRDGSPGDPWFHVRWAKLTGDFYDQYNELRCQVSCQPGTDGTCKYEIKLGYQVDASLAIAVILAVLKLRPNVWEMAPPHRS